MKLFKLLPTCFLALGLSISIAACDDGDDGGDSSDTNANDSTTDNNEDETTAGEAEAGNDVECSTFCTNYVDLCAQTGKSTEFELYDDCITACEAWDQAGVNCRNEQIIADACEEAGNMGSTC